MSKSSKENSQIDIIRSLIFGEQMEKYADIFGNHNERFKELEDLISVKEKNIKDDIVRRARLLTQDIDTANKDRENFKQKTLDAKKEMQSHFESELKKLRAEFEKSLNDFRNETQKRLMELEKSSVPRNQLSSLLNHMANEISKLEASKQNVANLKVKKSA